MTLKQAYGSNARDVIGKVKTAMARLQKDMPKGMHYEVSYDVSRFLDASMEKVVHTLFEAFVLVGIVVFVFLGDWRASVIPILAIPISLLGSFICDDGVQHHAQHDFALRLGHGDRYCGGRRHCGD